MYPALFNLLNTYWTNSVFSFELVREKRSKLMSNAVKSSRSLLFQYAEYSSGVFFSLSDCIRMGVP